MAKMSGLGRLSGPAAPGIQEFHRRKQEVCKLLREVDRGSRAAMRGLEMAKVK